jgi:signal transduction histidine kinase
MIDMNREQRDFEKALEGIFVPGATLKEIGEGLTSQLIKLVDLHWAALGVIKQQEGRIELLPLAGTISSDLNGQDTISLDGSPVEWVATNKCAMMEADLSSKSKFATGALLLRAGIVTAVYMPLFSQGEVYGSFMVGSHRPQAYKARELGILKQAAIKLASAVVAEAKAFSAAQPVAGETQESIATPTTTQLSVEAEVDLSELMLEAQKRAGEYFSTYVEEGRRRAEEAKESSKAYFATLVGETQERAKEQILVKELAGIIASGVSLPQAFQDFVDRLGTKIKFDHIAFCTLHGEGVHIEWASSPDNASPRADEVYPARDCTTLGMPEQNTLHIEDDLSANRQFLIDEVYLSQGRKSIIRVPITHGRASLGAINIASRQAKAYGEEEKRFLEQLRAQIGLPLAKLLLQSMGKERTEFLTALVHEVRTPLTSIISSSKLLKEEAGEAIDPFQSRLIDNVLQSAERMERRISYFFELAKLRNHGSELEMEILDIRPVLDELALRAMPIAHSKGQLVVAELPESLPWVKVDRKRIQQVMMTLLNNAMAFNSNRGTVTLKARGQDNRLVVEVVDSGPGFSPQEQEDMFKPYYPAEADRQRSPELRLGLAVARELVELHGGTLWMQSEPGKGSTFALSLPQTQ